MSEKIRVLKFLSVFLIGGTERQFVNVVKRLDVSQFDVHLACFQKFGPFLPEIEKCGYPLRDYASGRLYSLKTIAAQLRLAAYLRRRRIQVVHAYGLYPNLFAIPAARMAGVPVTIAGVRDMGAHASEIKRRAQRAVCGLATCVVANAEAVRSWLIGQGVSAGKIRVIRNGIVMEDAGRATSSVRQEFGVSDHAPIVGSVCRLTDVKGVEYLLEAAVMIRRTHPEVRFMIVGDGSHRAVLEARSRELGLTSHVIFAGVRTDAARFLDEFAVAVLPSVTEGLSNTLLESMAAGLPVVATRVGGAPEVVMDGVNGILVPPRDAPALARAISKLVEDRAEARRLGEAARRRIAEQFSIEETVRQTERLYRELLDGRRHAA